MNDEKEIVTVLKEKLTIIDGELAIKQEKFNQLQSEVSELEERKRAISLVIDKEFKTNPYFWVSDKQHPALNTTTLFDTADKKAETENNGNKLHKPTPVVKKRRRRGLLNTMRGKVTELPQEFDKYKVADILKKAHPELKGAINDSSLRGVLYGLVEERYIKVKIPADGNAPQIYEKI